MSPAPGSSTTAVVPEFLRLTGHPIRWDVLSQLARSDRRVRELTALVGQRQNLTSYHLRRLRDAGLVTMRRSSADNRREIVRREESRRRDRARAHAHEVVHRLAAPRHGAE